MGDKRHFLEKLNFEKVSSDVLLTIVKMLVGGSLVAALARPRVANLLIKRFESDVMKRALTLPNQHECVPYNPVYEMKPEYVQAGVHPMCHDVKIWQASLKSHYGKETYNRYGSFSKGLQAFTSLGIFFGYVYVAYIRYTDEPQQYEG